MLINVQLHALQGLHHSVVMYLPRQIYRLSCHTNATRHLLDGAQGTAAVVLAGILAARPLTGKALTEHTIMVAGEGAAGTALAELLAEAIARATMRCVRQCSLSVKARAARGGTTLLHACLHRSKRDGPRNTAPPLLSAPAQRACTAQRAVPGCGNAWACMWMQP